MREHDYSASGSRAAEVLLGAIVDDTVCARVAGAVGDERSPMGVGWQDRVLSWCVRHHREHGRAPRRGVESYFREWAEHAPRAEAELVGQFLSGLSDRYASLRAESVPTRTAELAGEHFLEVRLRKLFADGQAELDAGRRDRAKALVANFAEPGMGTRRGVDLFMDEAAVRSIFDKRRLEPLVIYDDALGHFFGDSLARGCFVSFMGPEGFGKSTWLLDVAWRAQLNRHRVAYFDCGDMTMEQVGERFMARAADRPVTSDGGKWPFTVKRPNRLRVTGVPSSGKICDEFDVGYDETIYKKPLDFDRSWAACERLMKEVLKANESRFRMENLPSQTVSVRDIADMLKSWALDGFRADVVIIDYADILKPPAFRRDTRDQHNDVWLALRAIPAQFHCLLVTATQTRRDSYSGKTIRMEDVGEDKRKLGQVHSMFGIAQTDAERELGVFRLSQPKKRRGRRSTRAVYVAGCMDVSNPAILSCYREGGENNGKLVGEGSS